MKLSQLCQQIKRVLSGTPGKLNEPIITLFSAMQGPRRSSHPRQWLRSPPPIAQKAQPAKYQVNKSKSDPTP